MSISYVDKFPFYGIMRGMENNAINNVQLILDEIKFSSKSCAFTGHRKLEKDFSVTKLKREIKRLMEEGVEVFYCGMAQGFDLTAGELVLKSKKKFPKVKLIICIPCVNQEKYYTAEDKKRYAQICKKADEVEIISDTYYKGCMLERDRYMADRADVLLAYLKKETGGTAYTVNYFKKKYPLKEVIFL